MSIDQSSNKKSTESTNLKKIKDVFFKWSENVDINVYNKMIEYGPNLKVQFIWLIILLGSTGATLYFISKSIIDYLKYDVVSQTSIVNELPTQFPTVTFCSKNPTTTEIAQTFMNDIARANNISTESMSEFEWSSLLNLSMFYFSSSLITDEVRKSLGLNIYQILCTFNYNYNCTNDLNWYWSFKYGNCFQFNAGRNLTNQSIDLTKVHKYGEGYGLKIKIFLINKNKFPIVNDRGVVVYVHNSSFEPSQEVFLKNGETTFIQVERTFIQKQPHPYSDCVDLTKYSSELYDYIIKAGQAYRQKDCFELCYQMLTLENCKCYDPTTSNLDTSLRPCLNVSDLECCDDQYEGFDLNKCETTYCPLECDTIKYDLTLSSLVYPTQAYFENVLNTQKERDLFQSTLNRTLSIDLYKEYYVSFNIFYPSLRYTFISESPKTSVSDLFSQIGGGLGLFVSYSIFTLFELIELLILILNGLFFS